jgi:hypothetical protein
MQAKRVRQDFSITEAAWNVRRELIRAEHRAEAARTELAQAWKQRLMSKGARAAAAPAAGAAAAASLRQLKCCPSKTKTNRNSERHLGRLSPARLAGPDRTGGPVDGRREASLPSGSRFCRHHEGGGVAVDD